MRNRKTLIAGAICAASLLAVSSASVAQLDRRLVLDTSDELPGGPLKPDSAIAKGYDDAAKALAMIDDNPVMRWEYNIWCVTGHRHPNEAAKGEIIDEPIDPRSDHFSPRGFHYSPKDDPARYGDTWIATGGARFMDNAWYVGDASTGGIIVRTPDGLLVFDTGRYPTDYVRIIKEMPAAGLDPKDIKYIFIGHSHNDHLAGVNEILKVAPRALVVAGEPDRQIILKSREALLKGPPYSYTGAFFERNKKITTPEEAKKYHETQLRAVPERVDIGVPAQPGLATGLMKIRVGPQTELTAVLAPGHTDGQTHYIVPVQHKGETHRLLIWSGNDQNANTWQYAISADYLRSVAAYEGADALINTHGYQSTFFSLVRKAAANPDGPNPIVMGVDGVDRYIGIFSSCQKAMYHRLKEKTWVRG